MAYVKYWDPDDWENLPSTDSPITAAALIHMETQYQELIALFNAHTILMAIADNDPAPLVVAANRIVGRAGGNIVALTGAQLMAILTGQAGADFSMNTHKITAVVDPTADQHADTRKARNAAITAHAGTAAAHHAATIIATGNYTGDSSVNRAIPHGLGVTPNMVHIINPLAAAIGWLFTILDAVATIVGVSTAKDGALAVTALGGTNFYVGNATDYEISANLNLDNYYWIAIGQ